MRNFNKLNNIISPKYSIGPNEAFFFKSKSWEYENEFRLVYYDVNGKGLHQSIELKNSIAAVYFGVNCSPQDQKTIINILKNRKCYQYIINPDIRSQERYIKTSPQKVEFFKMKKSDTVFGEVIAIKILKFRK